MLGELDVLNAFSRSAFGGAVDPITWLGQCLPYLLHFL